MPEPLHPGDPAMIGPYRLVSRLGRGGQGVVYLGHAPDGIRVAVKMLHDAVSPRVRERFVRELEAARRVDPFCIAQVLDASVDGPRPYIVTEFVEGPPLQEAGIHHGPALHRLAVATASALAAVHGSGIVHRDFKPANVLLAADGPRVIDFGIARDTSRTATVTSSIIGTPAYMAPEQLSGNEVGPAADVFAWAGVMVYAATGKPAFGSDHIPAVVGRILHSAPNLGDLAEPMLSIVGNCLAKDQALRPSMHEVLLQLLGKEQVRPLPAPGVLAGTTELTQPMRPRSRMGLLLGAGAGTAAVAVTATALVVTQLQPGSDDNAGKQDPTPASATRPPGSTAPSPSQDPENAAALIKSVRVVGSKAGGCYRKGATVRARVKLVDDTDPLRYRWVINGKESGVSTQFSSKGTFNMTADTTFTSAGRNKVQFRILRPGSPRGRTTRFTIC